MTGPNTTPLEDPRLVSGLKSPHELPVITDGKLNTLNIEMFKYKIHDRLHDLMLYNSGSMLTKQDDKKALEQLRQARDMMNEFIKQTDEYCREDITQELKLKDATWTCLFSQFANVYDIKVCDYLFQVDKLNRKVFVYMERKTGELIRLGVLTVGDENKQEWKSLSEFTDDIEKQHIAKALQFLDKSVENSPVKPFEINATWDLE